MSRKIILLSLSILVLNLFSLQRVNAKNGEDNKLTIISTDLEKSELLGFEYILENLDTGKEIKVSFKDKAKVELYVEDGQYILKQTMGLEGYEKEADIKFSLPSQIDPNTVSKEAIILTKHILEPEITLKSNDNPKTSDNIDILNKHVLLLTIAGLGILITKYSLRKDAK